MKRVWLLSSLFILFSFPSCNSVKEDDNGLESLLPLLALGGRGGSWSHQAYLKAPNNSNGDQFGYSVAISGDIIAVGATGEDSTTTAIIHGSDLSGANNSGASNGAVYVFTRSGSTWSHQAYLKAPNNTDNDQFGFSVAIYGDTIAVGAPYEDSDTTAIIHGSDLSGTNDSGNANGAVYVFTLSGGTWTHQAYLKAPNNGGAGVGNGDNIGSSVAIYGGTIAVGASNEASTTTDIIHGSNPSGTNDSGSQNGAVYVFTRQ